MQINQVSGVRCQGVTSRKRLGAGQTLLVASGLRPQHIAEGDEYRVQLAVLKWKPTGVWRGWGFGVGIGMSEGWMVERVSGSVGPASITLAATAGMISV